MTGVSREGDQVGTPPQEGIRGQQPLELILVRQLAERMPVAIFVSDPEGRLLYYNEPGAELAGIPFEETDDCRLEACMSSFAPTDSGGLRIPDDAIPLLVALRTQRPVHQRLSIRLRDGAARQLAVTALPIPGQAGTALGALAICWPADDA